MHLHLHLWAGSSFVRQLDELYVKLSCSVLMYSLFLSCTLSLQDCVMVAVADQHQGQRHSSGPWTAPDWGSVQHGAVGGWMMRSRWVSTPCCPANPQGNDTTIGGTYVIVWANKVRRSCRVSFLFCFRFFFCCFLFFQDSVVVTSSLQDIEMNVAACPLILTETRWDRTGRFKEKSGVSSSRKGDRAGGGGPGE